MPGKRIVYSVGHSNRPIEEFVSLLEENEIELLADVRTVPRSRTNPQFNRETLPGTLKKHGIEYIHLAALGGLRGHRKDQPASRNTYWENASFRNYADYAETAGFREGLDELIHLARAKRTAFMCAEALWWRCHRRIITDYLLAGGFVVRHIMGTGKVEVAKLNEHAAILKNGSIEYPGDQRELEFV
ncbi:MAG: DUF488 domain-containing protein [Bacteroidota bacterium]|nr:DUF488 domain-containing protein [Bacteroidota bacterium]MDP4233055.1 DUF488 domain-containing protein [Bacteroidota bacterium]MDP4241800.1 DUF488 domain-containing protein [Bacteroidota bacterium]MDP4288779.1 DUF488 domain-containing protein [Bacteroidota bacterium]